MIGFYHDPAAPVANSVRWADTGNWELPGGTADPGESAIRAAIGEVAEEAEVTISVTGLSGAYTDPGHVMVYQSCEVRQQFFPVPARCRHGR